jgi:hypothetical protein
MNTNRLQKHYDKLTAKERYAALIAAKGRGDSQEYDALVKSCPRKTWRVAVTIGIAEAFDSLAMFHVLMQLGYAASFYYLLANDDISEIKAAAGETVTAQDAMTLTQQRILEGREAWRAICKEHGLDPDQMLEHLPFVEMITINELIAMRAKEIAPFELSDLQNVIDSYRLAIETKRKEWE